MFRRAAGWFFSLPSVSKLIITEDALYTILTEDGLYVIITEG